MASVTIANTMAIGGDVSTNDKRLALALKIFSGEVLTAYDRYVITDGKFTERNIESGKSAQYPVIGRTNAHYLKPGESLDDKRENIKQGERTIVIDGLLTADCLIADIEDFIRHYDVRAPYAKQLGEALAISKDASILAEVAKEATNTNENVEGLGKGAVITKTLEAGQTVGINPDTGKMIYQILLEIGSNMSKNYVPENDRMTFVTPDYFAALSTVLDFLNKNYGANGTILEGKVIRLAGFDIYKCPHLTRGGDDNTNVLQGNGHVFPATYKDKNPILVCHPTAVGVLNLRGLAVETARRPEYQADQFIAKMAIGVGGLRPEAAYMGIIEAGE